MDEYSVPEENMVFNRENINELGGKSSYEKIVNTLLKMKQYKQVENIRIGFFGSYSRGEQNEESDLDIILQSNHRLLMVCSGLEDFIKQIVKEELGLDADVVDYADLIDDYNDAAALGIEEYSLKNIIDKEAVWIE